MTTPNTNKPAELKEVTIEPIRLVFTSKQALKRSIRLKYPKMTKDQWKATYEDQKQYVGVDVEEFLEKKYEEYKLKENANSN